MHKHPTVTKDTAQTIATFYKFAEFPEFKDWKNKLGQWGKELNILGTMILAPEGINATISGSRDGIEQFRHDRRLGAPPNPRCRKYQTTFIVCESLPVRKLSPWAIPRSIQIRQLVNM